jgi:hypothetical protein
MDELIKNASDPAYDPSKDPMHPLGNPCSICGTEYKEEEWGVLGWIGTLPVSFCPDCDQGIFNMVYSLTDHEDLEEILRDKKEEAE